MESWLVINCIIYLTRRTLFLLQVYDDDDDGEASPMVMWWWWFGICVTPLTAILTCSVAQIVSPIFIETKRKAALNCVTCYEFSPHKRPRSPPNRNNAEEDGRKIVALRVFGKRPICKHSLAAHWCIRAPARGTRINNTKETQCQWPAEEWATGVLSSWLYCFECCWWGASWKAL